VPESSRVVAASVKVTIMLGCYTLVLRWGVGEVGVNVGVLCGSAGGVGWSGVGVVV